MKSDRLTRGFRILLCLSGVALVVASILPELVLAPPIELYPEEKATAVFGVVLITGGTLLSGRLVRAISPLAAVSVIAAFAGEAFLRVAARDSFGVNIRLDDRLLFVSQPGARKKFRRLPMNGGDVINVETDSLGFRKRLMLEADTGDMLVLGDSFIASEFSQVANTFAEKLAYSSKLRLRAANAGTVGYGPDQAYLRMKADVQRLPRLRLVVFAINAGNDYGDIVRNRLFVIGPSGNVMLQNASLAASVRRGFARGEHRSMYGRLISRIRNAPRTQAKSIADGSDAARVLVDKWRADRLEEMSPWLRRDSVVQNLWDDTPDVDISTDPRSVSSSQKLEALTAVADSAAVLARSLRIPIVFVLIPSAIDVEDAYDGGIVDTLKYPAYQRASATGILAAALNRKGYFVVDLFPAFRANRGPRLYFRGGDNHWNDAGQALAARVVADSMRARQSPTAVPGATPD